MGHPNRRNNPEALFEYRDANQPSSGIYAIPRSSDSALHRGARRQYERWQLDAQVRIAEGEGVTLNASSGGLRVAIDSALAIGDRVDVGLETEAGTFSVRAEVVWCRASGGAFLSGLRFGQPDPRFRSPASLHWSHNA